MTFDCIRFKVSSHQIGSKRVLSNFEFAYSFFMYLEGKICLCDENIL